MDKMQNKLEIIEVFECNGTYDPDKELNRYGNYHQPGYRFVFNDKEGVYRNTSCSDFLYRYDVQYDDKRCAVARDSVQPLSSYKRTDFDLDLDKEFLKAFKEEFNIDIPAKDRERQLNIELEITDEIEDNGIHCITGFHYSEPELDYFEPVFIYSWQSGENVKTYKVIWNGKHAIWSIEDCGYGRYESTVLYSDLKPETNDIGNANKDLMFICAFGNTFYGHKWVNTGIPSSNDYKEHYEYLQRTGKQMSKDELNEFIKGFPKKEELFKWK